MAAVSKAEYLKRYLSGADADDGKKKKKKKEKKDKSSAKHKGMRIVEDDAFASVSYGEVEEVVSDDEDDIKIEAEVKKKMAEPPKFRNAFAPVDSSPKKEVLSGDDSSPARPSRQRHDSDSPPRRPVRHDSDNDHSPVRRRKRHDSDDNSPPRRAQRHDSDDNSPVRKPVRQRHDSDNSPPRRGASESGARRKRHDSDSSPVRKRKRNDSDNSPVRKRNASRSPDQSPPRRRRQDSDSDASPPRRPTGGRQAEGSRGRRVASPTIEETASSQQKTLDGKMAGLQSARDLKLETERLKEREAKMFEDLDIATSGRGADTVVREKQIKRGRDKPEDKEKKEREAKKQAELADKYKDWNKGVKQLQDRQVQLDEMARVAAEPLARRVDDEEMNRHLREQLHEDDPMAALISRKQRDNAIDRGDVVYPTYQRAFPPNRFGIRPGYRWDGVDRSNGFEGKLAVSGNKKRAQDTEFYQNIALYE